MVELPDIPSNEKACEVKAGIVKGALWRDNHKWYKTCKLTPTYINAIFWSTGKK